MGAVKVVQGAINTAPSPANIDAPSKAAGKAIEIYAGTQNLNAQAPNIKLDAVISAVTVAGVAPDQATKKGVAVNNLVTVSAPETESQRCTVVGGDNLSKISKQFCGTFDKHTRIFEANKPMLSHSDKIYSG